MRMFWEFFTFELRFRAKSPSTYIYFLLWLAFSFLCIASENFGPVANSNGKVLLNGPYGDHLQRSSRVSVRPDHHRRDFRHLDPARFSARHLSDSLYQAGFKIRLPGRALGRIFCRNRCGLQWVADRDISRHLGALGGSCPNRPEPLALVSRALPLHRRDSDIFHRLALFCRGGAHPQNFYRLPARRGAIHGVSGRYHGVFGNPFPGAFLVRHSRPGGTAAKWRSFALLERHREKHPAVSLGLFRVLAGRVSHQPAALAQCRCGGIARRLGAVSHVGRGADGSLAGKARGARARGRGGEPASGNAPSWPCGCPESLSCLEQELPFGNTLRSRP